MRLGDIESSERSRHIGLFSSISVRPKVRLCYIESSERSRHIGLFLKYVCETESEAV